jgi:DNA-binding LacI/PurR family transcriptional regulator
MDEKPTATIYDVAAAAGVSTATVSRLLNGIGSVGDDTRKRVEKAIKKLDYSPNRKRPNQLTGTGSSVTSRSPVAFLRIGDFLDEEQTPVTGELVEEMRRKTEEYQVPFSVHELPKIDPAVPIRDVIGKAKGVILRTSNIHEIAREAVEWLDGVPAVQVLGENRTGRMWVDHVIPDNMHAGALAAEYLIAQGCNRLVFAAPAVLSLVTYHRCESFVETAIDAGVEVSLIQELAPDGEKLLEDKITRLPAPCTLVNSQEEFMEAVAAETTSPCGLFIPSDMLLSLTSSRLQAKGVDFTHQVKAIGCNTETSWLSTMDPLPATLDLRIPTLVERALRRLQYRIQHPNEPLVRLSLAPHLVRPQELKKVCR